MTRGLQETSKWTALGILTTGTMITAQSGRIMIPKVGCSEATLSSQHHRTRIYTLQF